MPSTFQHKDIISLGTTAEIYFQTSTSTQADTVRGLSSPFLLLLEDYSAKYTDFLMMTS